MTLQELEETIAAMTETPWEFDGCDIGAGDYALTDVVTASCEPCGHAGCSGARVVVTDADAEGIATLRNIATELVAVVQALRLEHAACDGQKVSLDYDCPPSFGRLGPLPGVSRGPCPGCASLETLAAALSRLPVRGEK